VNEPKPRKRASARKAATSAASLPPFDGLDGAALLALARTLDRTFDEFAVDKKLTEAAGDERKLRCWCT
jgi:hypothetical protein